MMGNLRGYQRQGEGDRCQQCGKPVQGYRCGACDGSGRRRFLMLFSQTCDTCHGSGQIWHCPDRQAHLEASLAQFAISRLPPASRVGGGSLLGSSLAPGSRRQCWSCKGRGKIAGKKRIPNPKKYMRAIPGYETIVVDGLVACKVCRGSGWLAAEG